VAARGGPDRAGLMSRRTTIIAAVSVLAVLVVGVLGLRLEHQHLTTSGARTTPPALTSTASGRSASRTQGATETSAGTPPIGVVPSGSSVGLVDQLPLKGFVARCQSSQPLWRRAQISWPTLLELAVGEAKSYVAVVDATDNPAPPTVVIPGPNGTGTNVMVQCALAARLVSSDENLEVRSENASSGWSVQSFDVSDQLYWSWTVRAKKAGPRELSLQFRPVVRIAGQGGQEPSGGSTTFQRVTQVKVASEDVQPAQSKEAGTQGTHAGPPSTSSSTASVSLATGTSAAAFSSDPVAWAGAWVTAHQAPLAVIGTFLVAAVIGVLSALATIRKKYREVFRRGKRSRQRTPPVPADERDAADTSSRTVEKRAGKKAGAAATARTPAPTRRPTAKKPIRKEEEPTSQDVDVSSQELKQDR
jgi:hypothetical protein